MVKPNIKLSMWVKNELWLGRQRAVRSLYSVSVNRRFALSNFTPPETHNVPEIQSELDNFDNELAQNHDGWNSAQDQRNHVKRGTARGKEIRLSLAKQLNQRRGSKELSKKKSSKLPNSVYQPTNADFLALALSNQTDSKAAQSVQPVLGRQNISFPDTMEDFGMAIEQMREYASDHPSVLSNIQSEPSRGRPHLRLRSTILSCERLEDLSRVTGLLGQTTKGCELLSRYGAVIFMAIKKFLGPSRNFNGALTYINGLCLNLKSKGVHIGPDLCSAGMYFAARSRIFPALGRYIGVAHVEDHQTNATQLLTLEWTYKQLDLSRNRARQEILYLLTGWRSSGIPDYGEVRKPSFAHLAQKSHAMYSAYLCTLGKLGASEALWYEWSRPELTPMPSIAHSEPAIDAGASDVKPWDDDHQNLRSDEELRTEEFFHAFIEAKDFRRAKELLQSVMEGKDVFDHAVLEIPPGENPIRDGFESPNEMQLRNILLNLYLRHGISNVDSVTLRRDIDSIRSLTRPTEELVPEIEHLLLVKWVESEVNLGFHVREDKSEYSLA